MSTGHAAPDHDVGPVEGDPAQGGKIFGRIGAVGVEEAQQFAGRRTEPGLQGAAVALIRLADQPHPFAEALHHLGCAIL